ncbi:hypothetical protein [Mycoplasma todarodis]|uniref:Uncharacterized protein n=1 Tax=Mycoplasma todarodis TaxID=1937191 RepID=A0A4R0XJW9_9MOLU|nr:hypothetical protein [Mycoplasma todarodis]TCG10744.1 hypothetical protein C4B25_03110 [Mycoplasma todarodis]
MDKLNNKNTNLEKVEQIDVEEVVNKTYEEYVEIKEQLNGNKNGEKTPWVKIKNFIYSKTHGGKTKTEMITERGGEYWADIFQKKSFVFMITAVVALVFSIGILCGQYWKGSFAYKAMNNAQKDIRVIFIVILGSSALLGIVLTILLFTYKKRLRNQRLQGVNQRKLSNILKFLEKEVVRNGIYFDFKRVKEHLKIMNSLYSKENKKTKLDVEEGKEIKVKKKTKSSKNNAAQQMLLLICTELNFIYKICRIKRHLDIVGVKMQDDNFAKVSQEKLKEIISKINTFYKSDIIENMKYDGVFKYENEVVSNKLEEFSNELIEFSENVEEGIQKLAEGRW